MREWRWVLDCPSQVNSAAHALLQKQWSTSARKPLEKSILAANGQFHVARSFFQSKRWNFLYSQWQHSSWIPWKWEWILGISFFFFCKFGFINDYYNFCTDTTSTLWMKADFFSPPVFLFFFGFFFLVLFSFKAQRSLQDLEGRHLRKRSWV